MHLEREGPTGLGVAIAAAIAAAVALGCEPPPPKPALSPEPLAPIRRSTKERREDSFAGCRATTLTALASAHGLLHVPARLGTKPGTLLADMGSSYSTFDETWTRGLRSVPASPSGGAERVRFDDFNLGPLHYAHVSVATSRTPNISELPGVVGIIGTDFLSKYVVVYDWLAPAMIFVQEPDAQRCTEAWTFPSVPLEDYGSNPPFDGPPNIPTIRVSVAGLTDIPVQLDTGSNETEARAVFHVNAALGSLLRKRLGAMPKRVVSFTKADGKSVDVVFHDAPSDVALVAGPIRFEPIVIAEHPRESGGPYARTAPTGVLGATSLRRLGRVGFDPFRRTLHVMTPN